MISLNRIFYAILLIIVTNSSINAMKVSLLSKEGQKTALNKLNQFTTTPEATKQISIQFIHLDSSARPSTDNNNYNCMKLMCGKSSPSKSQQEAILLGLRDRIAIEGYTPNWAFFLNMLNPMDKNQETMPLLDQDGRQAHDKQNRPITFKFFCENNKEKSYSKVVLMCGESPATTSEQLFITNFVDAMLHEMDNKLIQSINLHAENSYEHKNIIEKHKKIGAFFLLLSIMNSPNDKKAIEFATYMSPSNNWPRIIDESCKCAVIFENTDTPCQKIAPVIDSCNPVTQIVKCEQIEQSIDMQQTHHNTIIETNIPAVPSFVCGEVGSVIYQRKVKINKIPIHIKQFLVNTQEESMCGFHDAFNLTCLMYSTDDLMAKMYLNKIEKIKYFQQERKEFSTHLADTKEPLAYLQQVTQALHKKIDSCYLENLTIIKDKNVLKKLSQHPDIFSRGKKERFNNGIPQFFLIAVDEYLLPLKISKESVSGEKRNFNIDHQGRIVFEKEQNSCLVISTTNSHNNIDVTTHAAIELIGKFLTE